MLFSIRAVNSTFLFFFSQYLLLYITVVCYMDVYVSHTVMENEFLYALY